MALAGAAFVGCARLLCRRPRSFGLCGGRCGPGSGASSRFCATSVAGYIAALFVVAPRLVVSLSGGIEARVQAVLGKLKAFFDNERRVGEVDQVVFGDAVVL